MTTQLILNFFSLRRVMLIAEMQYLTGLTSTGLQYQQLEKALAAAKQAIAANRPVDDCTIRDMRRAIRSVNACKAPSVCFLVGSGNIDWDGNDTTWTLDAMLRFGVQIMV